MPKKKFPKTSMKVPQKKKPKAQEKSIESLSHKEIADEIVKEMIANLNKKIR